MTASRDSVIGSTSGAHGHAADRKHRSVASTALTRIESTSTATWRTLCVALTVVGLGTLSLALVALLGALYLTSWTYAAIDRNLPSSDQIASRKIREALLAYQLTEKLSKGQILALYLNEIDGRPSSAVDRDGRETCLAHDAG